MLETFEHLGLFTESLPFRFVQFLFLSLANEKERKIRKRKFISRVWNVARSNDVVDSFLAKCLDMKRHMITILHPSCDATGALRRRFIRKKTSDCDSRITIKSISILWWRQLGRNQTRHRVAFVTTSLSDIDT